MNTHLVSLSQTAAAAALGARPVLRCAQVRRAWRWMRATGCLAGACLLLALTSGGAGAQQGQNLDSANYMLPRCKRYLVDGPPGGHTFWEGVCAGSIVALAFVGRNLSRPFCIPDRATNEQQMRIVTAYIEARPARMHEDFRQLALEALREAWPCN
jgi:hypothetical protein